MPETAEKKEPFESWMEATGFVLGARALISLCGQVLFKPADFFKYLFSLDSKALLESKVIVRSVLFALILGYIKLFLDIANLWWLKYFSVFPDRIFLSPFFILRPIFLFLATLVIVSSGVKLILGFDKSLAGVFLVVCYRAASDLFYMLPLVGGIFALAWSVTLLAIGLRQAYRVGYLRSIVSGILMPAMISFFILLSIGPALKRTIVAFYPELKVQMVKINDITAYFNTASIVSAAETYKRDLGFYPPHLGALSKYIADASTQDFTGTANPGGYIYQYNRSDDSHYSLTVTPVNQNVTGSFIFFADEKGEVHLGSEDGQVIKSISDLEKRLSQR